jgi:hypothetical protein
MRIKRNGTRETHNARNYNNNHSAQTHNAALRMCLLASALRRAGCILIVYFFVLP